MRRGEGGQRDLDRADAEPERQRGQHDRQHSRSRQRPQGVAALARLGYPGADRGGGDDQTAADQQQRRAGQQRRANTGDRARRGDQQRPDDEDGLDDRGVEREGGRHQRRVAAEQPRPHRPHDG